MLTIKDLHAAIDGKEILKGLNLNVKGGEVHAIMGPNGAGKSTLGHVIAGRPGYEATSGSIEFKGKDLMEMDTSERAREGVFLAFQYPVEITGVTNMYFLKAAVNAVRKYRGQEEFDSMSFIKLVKEKADEVEMKHEFLYRGVNEGFSGGEKKRNEILQMSLLEPSLGVLDETDSGLDIDALRIVADGVNRLRHADRGIILVTHYQRLLDYIEPDFVHVLADGKIVQSGDKSLALELEKKGYGWIEKNVA